MTILQSILAALNWATRVNENFSALSAAAIFGYRAAGSSALTWGYYGGLYNGSTIADGTLTLTNGADNYIVVLRSSGVVSVSTSNTNSVNPLYAKLYKVTCAGGLPTVVVDQRTDTNGLLFLATGATSGREILAANRAYYVGANIPTPTITIASPAVVSSAAHGLSAGAQVVFNVPRNTRAATMTIASPGVVTLNSHGFSAGQPIAFSTTNGALPTGITAGTIYYVIATGLTSNAFQFSASVGGSAVNTSGSQSGTHFVTQTGALPTGITEGVAYYVIAAGLTANAFEVSATLGGSAINTSGSVTGSPIYGAYTGSDSNTGLAQTPAGALLTIQQAVTIVCGTLDLGNYNVTINVAPGTYTGANVLSHYFAGLGSPTILGNTTTPSNILVSVDSATCFTGNVDGGVWTLSGMKMQTTTSGAAIRAAARSSIYYNNVDFGATAWAHIYALADGNVLATGDYKISGGGFGHWNTENQGYIQCVAYTVTITNTPAWSNAFVQTDRGLGLLEVYGNTYTGLATGKRYTLINNSVCFTNGAATTAFPGNVSGTIADGALYK